jgi:hypothetical protein
MIQSIHHFFTVSIFEPAPKWTFLVSAAWFTHQQIRIWRIERNYLIFLKDLLKKLERQ